MVARHVSMVVSAMALAVAVLVGGMVYETPKAGAAGATGNAVVREARTWLGVPYDINGLSRQGISNTGLINRVYRQFGYRLPAFNIKGQYDNGRPVKRSNLRRGDLVFFDSWKPRGEIGPGDEVGIYSGDGRFIWSSSYYTQVIETQVRYKPRYFGARRILR